MVIGVVAVFDQNSHIHDLGHAKGSVALRVATFI